MTVLAAVARRRPLAAFVVLAYLLSWSWWVPLVLRGDVVRWGAQATQFPGLVGPQLSAFTVTALVEGRPGVRRLAARMIRWRVPLRWWLFAVGSPLLLLVIATGMAATTGASVDLTGFTRMAGLPDAGLFVVWGAMVVVNAATGC